VPSTTSAQPGMGRTRGWTKRWICSDPRGILMASGCWRTHIRGRSILRSKTATVAPAGGTRCERCASSAGMKSPPPKSSFAQGLQIGPQKSACGNVSRVRHMVPGGSRESLPNRKVRVADKPRVILLRRRTGSSGQFARSPICYDAYWKFSAIVMELCKALQTNHTVRPSREAARFAVHGTGSSSNWRTGVSRFVWKL
jgi:hypothetical protein